MPPNTVSELATGSAAVEMADAVATDSHPVIESCEELEPGDRIQARRGAPSTSQGASLSLCLSSTCSGQPTTTVSGASSSSRNTASAGSTTAKRVSNYGSGRECPALPTVLLDE